MNHLEIADELYNAREEHDRLKELCHDAHMVYKRVCSKLIEAMADEDVQHFKRRNITISTKKHFSISVTADNDGMIRSWLMDTYGDDTDFLIEKVGKAILTDKIREEVIGDEKYEHEYPDFLNLQTARIIQVDGWKDRNL